MIDALATAPHYADHIRPVFDALPDAGLFKTRPAAMGKGAPTIVASFADSRWAHQRAVIYMEHGAGQTYGRAIPSYAGGRGKGHVALFLSPSEPVAEMNRAVYPNVSHAVIGCPLLDPWIGYKPQNDEPVVAFAWHFNAIGVAQEARSAFDHYVHALADLAARQKFRLLGHAHPRAMGRIRPHYERMGIEVAERYTDVLERADVLVFDNTSAGFMFAATDRPVVVLDAPWYKASWGGRFWDWADVGVRISDPAQLEKAIETALADKRKQKTQRHKIVRQIYGDLDGTSTQKAVRAIEAWQAGELRAAA